MRASLLVSIALVVGAAGCFIGAGSFAGKGCDTNNDCPEPYVCAQVRGSGRSCELVHRIDIGGGAGGGSQSNLDPDYCVDAKPILDRTCVSNCHGTDTSGSSLPFRFDVYSDPAGGSFEKALRIKARVTVDDMPPSGPANPRPSAAERSLLIRWVNTGAKQCNDAGTGGMTDAGTDAGSVDGGDAG
jgi:hypothetical protein